MLMAWTTRSRMARESFNWSEPLIKFMREDESAKYYKVEALLPLSSMNDNLYTRDDIVKNARSLMALSARGVPIINLNHEEALEGISVFASDCEDDVLEVILKVLKDAIYNGKREAYRGKKIVDLIDSGEILQVSIEGRGM